jgi:ribosomal protein S12 methylthiotransferase accessory factor
MQAAVVDLGGTVRALPAEETLRWLQPLLPRFGITRVARLVGLDHLGIPVSTAIRPLGRLLSTSQGKGVTPELADISAIMEAIETWHAERVPPGLRASCAALRAQGRAFVAPASLRLLPGLRRRLDEDTVLSWLPAQDLAAGAGPDEVLLPRACLDLDTTDPATEAEGQVLSATTTGLAAGNTLEEATLHALYEVVERDAHSRFAALPPARQAERGLDPESVPDGHEGHLRGLLLRLRAAGMRVQLFEMTSARIPVPVFLCRLLQPDATTRWFIDEGAGAHGRPEIALSRAITEAVQSRLSYIAGSRDDLYPHMYAQDLARAQLWARDDVPRGTRPFSACPELPQRETLGAQLAALIELLRAAGVTQVLRVDHTRSEAGAPMPPVPVVHVRCPQLADAAG